MASTLVTALLVLVGIALAVGGFLFFRAALYLLGLLLGLSLALAVTSSGYVPPDWEVVVLVVGPIVGIGLAATVKFLVIAVPGALMGAGAAVVVQGIPLTPVENLADPTIAVGALVGLVVAWLVETPFVVLVSASWGATMLSAAAGANLGAVFDAPGSVAGELFGAVFWVVFVGGVVAQAAVWYYLRTALEDGQDARDVVLRRAGQRVGSLRN